VNGGQTPCSAGERRCAADKQLPPFEKASTVALTSIASGRYEPAREGVGEKSVTDAAHSISIELCAPEWRREGFRPQLSKRHH